MRIVLVEDEPKSREGIVVTTEKKVALLVKMV